MKINISNFQHLIKTSLTSIICLYFYNLSNHFKLTTIKKLSDLLVGETYFVCFGSSGSYVPKAKFKGFINERKLFISLSTELHFHILEKKGLSMDSYISANEIGIGKTRLEAIKNYRKFKFEDISYASPSMEEYKTENNLHRKFNHWFQKI